MIHNRLEIRVAALRRSGHHAVILWLLRQLQGQGCFLNNCRPGVNPFESCSRRDSFLEGVSIEDELDEGITRKDYLIYNYEEKDLSEVFCDRFEELREQFVGRSERRFDLIVLRDPFNNFASLLQWAQSSGYAFPADVLQQVNCLWKQYAREFLGETRHLGDGGLMVNFNRWFAERAYRHRICARLGVEFSDAGLQEVADWGPASSFDGVRYQGRAQQMKVEERWRKFRSDPYYRSLFDRETLELSRRIFGPMAAEGEVGSCLES